MVEQSRPRHRLEMVTVVIFEYSSPRWGENNERGAAKLARHAGPVVHSRGEREPR